MRYIERKQSKGTWCVWDRVLDLPAVIDGRMLVGLSPDAASREASNANEAWLRWRPGRESLPAAQLRTGMGRIYRSLGSR